MGSHQPAAASQGEARPPYRNIVVAYDGSEGAKAALERAAEIAESGAALTVVESVSKDMPALVPGAPRSVAPERAAGARQDVRAAVASLDPRLEASPWVVGGPPADAILTVADDIRADLIVTGSRCRGRLTSALLGSVSTEILQGARCDVLVIRPRK
jgi:nucleotide-binding universal stress UspA family protein